VAAAIVGLTEGVIANLDDLPPILAANAIDKQRIAPILRAVTPYADLLDPNAVRQLHTPASDYAEAPTAWWKRLFG
jgi:hypothetical protein